MRILSIDSSLGSQVALLELPGTLEGLLAPTASGDVAASVSASPDAPTGPTPTAPAHATAQHAAAFLGQLTVLTEVSQSNSRAHAESLGPMMEHVLVAAPGELDLIVAATGPAPFTGLRAGLVSARVMARARRIPIIGVPSLESVARRAFDELPSDADLEIQVATDARRKEVYTCRLRARGAHDVETLSEIEVLSPTTLAERLTADGVPAVAGSGIELYPELGEGRTVLAPISGDAVAQAHIALARLTAGRAPEDMPTEPLYLRYADVHMPQGKKS